MAFLATLAIVVGATSPQVRQATAAPVRQAPTITAAAAVSAASTTVGIADSDLYFHDGDPAAVARRLDAVKALGVTNVRIALPWAAVETAKGQYAWTGVDTMINAAASRDMGVLAVVTTSPDWARAANTSVYYPPTNAADYGNFMGALAQRYGAKISSYEVWNEPNAALGYLPGPDPAGYTALLKAAYPKIKAANASATVIGGVLGSVITWGAYTLNPVDFVKQMYTAGAGGSFDALSFHPYQDTTPFSQGLPLPESPINQVNAMHAQMAANGDSAKKIWATEYGLASGPSSTQKQSQYVGDFINSWHTLAFAGPAFIYTLVDRNSADTSDPENTFGVYDDTWAPKPSASVITSFVSSTA